MCKLKVNDDQRIFIKVEIWNKFAQNFEAPKFDFFTNYT